MLHQLILPHVLMNDLQLQANVQNFTGTQEFQKFSQIGHLQVIGNVLTQITNGRFVSLILTQALLQHLEGDGIFAERAPEELFLGWSAS
jgi:hypothetical protein